VGVPDHPTWRADSQAPPADHWFFLGRNLFSKKIEPGAEQGAGSAVDGVIAENGS
jgi:hypothetical protein